MSSDSSPARPRKERSKGTLAPLLDPLTGLAVWSVHFLSIYCANALACARGIGSASGLVQHGFRLTLAGITLVALLAVALHARHAWRRRDRHDTFMAELSVGCDAVAAFGVAVQLVPIAMLHLCR
jgi:hypothetical protein